MHLHGGVGLGRHGHGDVPDGLPHTGDGTDLADRVGGEHDAFGERLRHVAGDGQRLLPSDDDLGGEVALRCDAAAEPGLQQHAEPGDQGGGEEHGDEDPGEPAAVVPDGGEGEAPHGHHSPRLDMRSTTACAVGRSSEPTSCPSARNSTRSA